MLTDYDLVASDPDLGLIQQALRLSIPALARNRSHLPGQLPGRLKGSGAPPVQTLLKGAEEGPGELWLRPRSASLTPPGGPLRQILVGHQGPILAVAFLPDESRALSGSYDKTLRLWDLATGATLRTLEGHTSSVRAVAVLADGSRALSGSGDNTLRLWDLPTGDCLVEYYADAAIGCVAFARDDLIVAGSADGGIHILEIREQ